MSYTRVIPRDLFNEAKLLKCLGRLALKIHDGCELPAALTLEHDDPAQGFVIEQDNSSGALYVSNLTLFFKGRSPALRLPYNSKDNYPLLFSIEDTEERVFDESGDITPEFHTMLATLET